MKITFEKITVEQIKPGFKQTGPNDLPQQLNRDNVMDHCFSLSPAFRIQNFSHKSLKNKLFL